MMQRIKKICVQAAFGLLICLCTVESVCHASSIKSIAVSVNPLVSIVQSIAGPETEVQPMVAAGRDPHTFELSPGTMRMIATADLLVFMHPKFEFWGEKLTLDAQERSLWLEGTASHNSHYDVHDWLDPIKVIGFAEKIKSKLCNINRSDCEIYQTNFEKLKEELRLLSEDITYRAGRWKKREFVADHPAWRAFAVRYGLIEVAVLRESEMKQITVKEMAALIKMVTEKKVSIFISDAGGSSRISKSFLNETGLAEVQLDSFGHPGESYTSMMQRNLAKMESAFAE
ncbi:MAG: zinc ABC transporter substrate-binding protein [Deltaproteobacteria bacterium]|nr:zinc ABC transporter substrate-binding protein [Deltaproteobacteria bacterium]